MIEDKSAFAAFARLFGENLKRHHINIKPSKVRELLSVMVGATSHNNLISKLPKPYEDWQDPEALSAMEITLRMRHGAFLPVDRAMFMQSVIDAATTNSEMFGDRPYLVYEAWIIHPITAVIDTDEGSFKPFFVMDAAYQLVVAHELFRVADDTPTLAEVDRLLLSAYNSSVLELRQWPTKIVISKDQANWESFVKAGRKRGVKVERVEPQLLDRYVRDVEEGFHDYIASAAPSEEPPIRVEKHPLSDDILDRAGVSLASDTTLSEAQEQAIGEAFLSDYYRNWLDQPIPALDNKTPRQASTTPEGIAQLESLFEYMQDLPTPPSMKPDVVQLRKELGLPPR